MMPLADFRVLVSHRAEKGLGGSEGKMRQRIREILRILQTNPVPAKVCDVTKISESDSNYRIRISGYRILYCVLWEQKTVKVYDIDRRKGRTYK